MGKVNTAWFIARRIGAGMDGRGNGAMITVATLSVGVGLAVMIIALSVIFGFKREITDKLTGALSHVRITRWEAAAGNDSEPVSANQPFLDSLPKIKGFRSLNRFAEKGGVLLGKESIQGVLLKGVGGDFDPSFFESSLVEGSLPVVTDSARNKDVLISKRLADQLELSVGDRIELMYPGDALRPDPYRIAGLYETDLKEVDERLILTDIRNVQRANRWTYDQIGGFELTAGDFRQLDGFSQAVFDLLIGMEDRIADPLMVINLREENPMIFDWLETHDLNALIIIVVMLLVAVFNMITALLILLLEKTQLIGILKALGMENGPIRRIFVYRSSRIVLKGMLWGNAAGLTLCWLQQATGVVKLNADGYFLARVPIHIDWAAVGLLNAGVFAVIVTMQVLPTLIVSRISPEKTIRFD
jgi:lipoprotein-releasing system permease protein